MIKLSRAIEIINTLIDGIDPFTGEVYSKDSIFKNTEIIDSLTLSLKGLIHLEKIKKRATSLPKNAGRPWTIEFDNELINKFDNGTSIKDLSIYYKRTKGAIRARLIKLGKNLEINYND